MVKICSIMGQYIFSINGTSISEEEIGLLKNVDLFGIVLFSRNIASSEQVLQLNKNIKNSLGSHIKICVDQEGGAVQRVNFGNKYPSSIEYTKSYKEYDTMELINAKVEQMSIELKQLGFDINFAPVVDLLVNDTYISNRSFSSNPDDVIAMAKQFIQISQNAGIECVLKHIPGHGRAKNDSHKSLPIINEDLQKLEGSDFKIFKQLEQYCDFAMTCHVVHNALDPENPVTVSKKAIDYIKKNIFSKTIMTDAIEMGALIDWHNPNVKKIHYNDYSASESVDFSADLIEFRSALKSIINASFSAGVDIVLHTSGNFDEMKYILQK